MGRAHRGHQKSRYCSKTEHLARVDWLTCLSQCFREALRGSHIVMLSTQRGTIRAGAAPSVTATDD